jgi:leader peptidase (prepilin peptidase)/N-methyltransferase
MNAELVVGCGVAGAVLGDVYEALVTRSVRRDTYRPPWWACESCHEPADGVGTLPLLHALVATQACSACGHWSPTARRPLLMVVITAAVFAAVAAALGAVWPLPAYLVAFSGMIVVSVTDVVCGRIPNRIIYPTLAASGALFVLASAVDHDWAGLGRAALCALGAGAFILAIHLVSPAGMGMGDVRLEVLVGLNVGYLADGYRSTFLAVVIGFLAGSFFAVGKMIATGAGRRTTIRFGPFLALGALVMVLWHPVGAYTV